MINLTPEEIENLRSELIPCPFCGDLEITLEQYEGGWYVECDCECSLGPRSTPLAIINQWNRRVVLVSSAMPMMEEPSGEN